MLNDRKEVAFRVPITEKAASEFAEGKRIMVGVRPHRIQLAAAAETDGVATSGEVTTNHWLGDQSQVGLQIGGCHAIAVCGRDLHAPVGSHVSVVIPGEAVRIFDADSGVAIEPGLASDGSPVA